MTQLAPRTIPCALLGCLVHPVWQQAQGRALPAHAMGHGLGSSPSCVVVALWDTCRACGAQQGQEQAVPWGWGTDCSSNGV